MKTTSYGSRDTIEDLVTFTLQLTKNVKNNTSIVKAPPLTAIHIGLTFFVTAGLSAIPGGGALGAIGGASTVAGSIAFL